MNGKVFSLGLVFIGLIAAEVFAQSKTQVQIKGPTQNQLVQQALRDVQGLERVSPNQMNANRSALSGWSEKRQTYWIVEESSQNGSEIGLRNSCQRVQGSASNSGLVLEINETKSRGCRTFQTLDLRPESSFLDDGFTECRNHSAAVGGGRAFAFKLIRAGDEYALFAMAGGRKFSCQKESWNVPCPDKTVSYCSVDQVVAKTASLAPNHLVARARKPTPTGGTCTAQCAPAACSVALAEVSKQTSGLFYDKTEPQIGVFKTKKSCERWQTKRASVRIPNE